MSAKYKNLWRDVYRVRKIDGCHAWIVPRDKPMEEAKRVHLNQVKRFFCEEEREVDKKRNAPDRNKPGGRRKDKRNSKPARPKDMENNRESDTQLLERDNQRYNLRNLRKDETGRTRPT